MSVGDKWKGSRASQPRARRAAAVDPVRRQRRRRLLIAGAVLLVGLGIALGFILRIGGKITPYALSLVVTEMEDPLWPVTAWGRQDSERLVPLEEGVRPVQHQNVAGLQAKLAEAASNAGKRPLLVHLVCQVIITAQGPELVTSDTSARAVGRRLLPLQDVLDRLQRDDIACLLLLDLRTVDQPWLGGLGDLDRQPVFDKLKAFYQALSTSKLVTLCYCHAGSAATVSGELGGGIFARAVHEALNGLANGWNAEGLTDVNLTCEEVANYVVARVQRWDAVHRLPPNLPRFYAKSDFIIRTESAASFGSETEIKPHAPYPSALKKAWQKRDEAVAKGTHLIAPLGHRRWETALARAEQRWLGGAQDDPANANETTVEKSEAKKEVPKETKPEEQKESKNPSKQEEKKEEPKEEKAESTNVEWNRVLNDLNQEINRIKEFLEHQAPQDTSSLVRTPITIANDVETALTPLAAVLQKLTGAAPVQAEVWNGLIAAARPKLLEHPGAAAQKIIDAARRWNPPTAEQLRRSRDLLEEAGFPLYAETNHLSYLAGLNDVQMNRWKDHLGALMELGRAAQEVVVDDARALPYVAELCQKVDKESHEILQAIYNYDLQSDARAVHAKNISNLIGRYRNVHTIAQAVSAALRERDACLALLPHFTVYDPPDPELSQSAQAAWSSLIGSLQQLVDQLGAKQGVELAWAEQLRGRANLVRQHRLQLESAIAATPGLPPPWLLRQSLLCPVWTLPIRQGRFTKSCEDESAIIREALTPLDQHKVGLLASRPPDLTPPLPNALTKAARVVDVLRLAGHPRKDTLAGLLTDARNRQDQQSWQALRQGLTEIWANPVTEADPVDRAWYASPFGEKSEQDALWQARLANERDLVHWIAQRYERLAQALDRTNKPIADRYRDLAGKVKRLAP
jgi:hypothetical protein